MRDDKISYENRINIKLLQKDLNNIKEGHRNILKNFNDFKTTFDKKIDKHIDKILRLKLYHIIERIIWLVITATVYYFFSK